MTNEIKKQVIFEFPSASFTHDGTQKLTLAECEILYKNKGCVNKYCLGENYTLEDILNDNPLDTDNCWYRVFNV